MTISVAIYLFEDVEILDFSGPYEVFSTASRLSERISPSSARPFEVFTVARKPGKVRARGGLRVYPDYSISGHPSVGVLIVPGGVVTAELECPEVINWIKATATSAQLTASVCTGAFLLAKAGLLDGKRGTTHWEDIADFRKSFPAVAVIEDCRWVDEGRIVTSAGISAGIDMSLHLVARIAGEGQAIRTAQQLDFDWKMNPQVPLCN